VDAVDALIIESNVVVVGFFDNDDSEEYKQFQTAAESLRESTIFDAVIEKPEVNKKFEVESVPSVVLFKSFDEGKNVLPASGFGDLINWIKANSIPLIDEIGAHNYRTYFEAGRPLAYLFVDFGVADQKEKYVELVRPLARRHKGEMNWVYIDWQKFAKMTGRLGLSGNTVPALAIENLVDGRHYAFDESAEITIDTVTAWTEKFLSGTLEPTIKSEEIPEDNSGPVKEFVAKTLEEIANDPTKDVLVEFNATWSGHCKALAPVYEQVGAALKDIDSIVIAKIDATNNDVSPALGIQGFPTIKLFRANDKENPIDYEGDRTKKDFITFLRKNASIKFEHPVDDDDDDDQHDDDDHAGHNHDHGHGHDHDHDHDHADHAHNHADHEKDEL